MKESEYNNVTNLTRLRIALSILRELNLEVDDHEEVFPARQTLRRVEQRMSQEVMDDAEVDE